MEVFVGQDLFDLVQGEGVFMNDGVVAGSFFVFGDPQWRVEMFWRNPSSFFSFGFIINKLLTHGLFG